MLFPGCSNWREWSLLEEPALDRWGLALIVTKTFFLTHENDSNIANIKIKMNEAT